MDATTTPVSAFVSLPQCGKLPEELNFPFLEMIRQANTHGQIQIPELILSTVDRHPESHEPEFRTIQRFLRDVDLDRTFEG
jgi:hypothetical protein